MTADDAARAVIRERLERDRELGGETFDQFLSRTRGYAFERGDHATIRHCQFIDRLRAGNVQQPRGGDEVLIRPRDWNEAAKYLMTQYRPEYRGRRVSWESADERMRDVYRKMVQDVLVLCGFSLPGSGG